MPRAFRIAYWATPLLFCLIVYWPSMQAWFQKEDFLWIGLRLNVHSWRELLSALFTPTRHGTLRPLAERAFFLAFSALFGLEALPYRIWVFATQLANLALLSSIVLRVTKSRLAGFLAPILWTAVSAVAIVIAWTSIYIQIACGFCLLLAFHFLLRYIETGRRVYYVWQWIVFLVGFGAMETNVVYPALAASYTLLCARKYFRSTLPLFLASIAFVAVHMMVAPKQSTGLYTLHFDWAIPRTLAIYWKLALDPVNVRVFTSWPRWFISLSVILSSAALLGFTAWQAKRKHWLPAFFLSWFAIALAPVLPLKEHITPYYLFLPSIGLAALGALAFASAWQKPIPWKTAAVMVTGLFLITSLPSARGASRWWRDSSLDMKRLAAGVLRARELHPGKVILLSGVSNDQFWGGIFDGLFRTLGVSDVYLAPGSESGIQAHPEIGFVAEYVLSMDLARSALDRQQAVVYEVGPERLKNITSDYDRSTAYLKPKAPRRVDLGNPLVEHLLGPTWYPREDSHRWMPRSASLRIGGPQFAGEKLRLSGFCPDVQCGTGPVELSLQVEGKAMPAVRIERPGTFSSEFELPGELAGKPEIEIKLEVNRTIRPPNDGRDLGLAFGVFEIYGNALE